MIRHCIYEDYLLMESEPAIKGLHSNFIVENIIASQRPSTRLIQEHNIIKQMLDMDIKAIYNLQEKGEHPHCGYGIHEESGFSYDPKHFEDAGIKVHFYGWSDDDAPNNFEHMLAIVDQMKADLQSGAKILIHCHAGIGRTGTAISCYLLYTRLEKDASLAIQKVRKSRPRSIGPKQERFIFQFEQYLKSQINANI